MKKIRKIFLGPPGSGKGTVASKIAPKLNIPHISTGDLFRENFKNNTSIGKKAEEYTSKGELVPDSIVIEMLKQRISEKDCDNGFILDGFPRTIPQAEMLHDMIEIDLVVNIDVSDEIIIDRICSRVGCIGCGKIYNLKSIPPKKQGICDHCNGEVLRRKDDHPEIIKKRLEAYQDQTKPLVDFYKEKQIIKSITCHEMDQTPEQTFQQVIELLDDFGIILKNY